MDVLVSIVIPAYNVENYIFRAIESSMNQSYPHIEIVIVDDGSTDRTWRVIEDYCKQCSFIKAYKQENKGVSSARNNALLHCKGKYVIFLDSDDWLEENAVQRLILRVESSGDNLICCDRYFAYYDKNGSIYKEPQCQEHDDVTIDRDTVLATEGTGEYSIQSSCYKLFSLKKIRDNNLRFSESIYHGEDGLFVFRYLQLCSGITFIYEALWNILERPGSATTDTYNTKWLTILEAIDAMIELSKSNLEIIDSLEEYKKTALLMLISSYLGHPIPKDDYHRIKNEVKKYISKRRTLNLRFIAFMILPRSVLLPAHKAYLKVKELRTTIHTDN